jgi:putative ABC transport system permease protein
VSTLLTLAWRNVWRNRRRSGITILTVAAGLAAILFGQSLIKTIQHQLILKATGIYTGHLQIVAQGVKDYKFPDVRIADPAEIDRRVAGAADIAAYQKRDLVTGMVSSKTESSGILIIGVDPARDREIHTIHTYMTQGRYLQEGDEEGVVFGERMAKTLGVKLGDEVVLLASSVDGSLGAELVKIVGLYDSGSHTFDNSIVYAPIAATQRLLASDDEVNNFVFRVTDIERLYEIRAQLAALVADLPVEVVTWEQVDLELVGIREYQNAVLTVILGVVFVIVALGIVNTLLMAMYERVREFGVVMAIGARPSWIRQLIIIESLIVGLLGALLGLAGGAALIIYYGQYGLHLPLGEAVGFFMPFDPVLFLKFDWSTHVWALGAVVVTSVLAGIPPGSKATALKPAEALRQL